MKALKIHPTNQELTAFGLGKLDESEAEPISEHLAVCDPCMATLTGIESDTFVDLIERADRVILPTQTGENSSQPGDDSVEIPPALAKHARYRTVELIGRGGMGEVFKAEHRLMNRTVALKSVNRKLVNNADAVDRFRREVQAAAQLSHPNIVTAHDAEQIGDLHFLVMECVDGTDLSQVVRERGPLPINTACQWIAQAASGLQHAHERGMIHRDIKPHNLMVTADGVIKILDFGLATFASSVEQSTAIEVERQSPGDESGRQLTRTGTAVGTPDFIAPEQSVCGQQADERSDIYSLGCTLYFLLAGHPAFADGCVSEKLDAHRNRAPQSIDELRDDVPPALCDVLARMMAKEPNKRIQTASEVSEALRPWLHRPDEQPRQAMASGTTAVVGCALAIVALALFAIFPGADDDSPDGNKVAQAADGKAKRSALVFEIERSSAYQLPEGRSLKWIPPTETGGRPHSPHMNSSGQVYELDGDKIRLTRHGLGEPVPLYQVVFSLLRLSPCELSGDAAVWTAQIPGDFIIRKGATEKQIVRDLSRTLGANINIKASLGWTEKETEVWVVDGTLKPAPSGDSWKGTQDKAYVLFGKNRTGNCASNVGTFDELLNEFGTRAGRPVVDQLNESPAGSFAWQTYYDDPEDTHWNEFPVHLAKNVEQVVEHFRQQTGLQISVQKRSVRLLEARAK